MDSSTASIKLREVRLNTCTLKTVSTQKRFIPELQPAVDLLSSTTGKLNLLQDPPSDAMSHVGHTVMRVSLLLPLFSSCGLSSTHTSSSSTSLLSTDSAIQKSLRLALQRTGTWKLTGVERNRFSIRTAVWPELVHTLNFQSEIL